MRPSDLRGLALHSFIKVGVAEYLYLNRSAVSGIQLVTTKMTLEEIPSIHVHEVTMGKDGIHVGYLFKTPKRVACARKSLIFAPPISIDAAKTLDAVFYDFFYRYGLLGNVGRWNHLSISEVRHQLTQTIIR